MNINVGFCARCGEDHEGLEFKLFTHVVDDMDGPWTHWALCPTNGEPILMKIVSTMDGLVEGVI
jgi:hypothetical protein